MSHAWMRAAVAALAATAIAVAAGCAATSRNDGSASSGAPSVNPPAASQAIAEYTGKPTAFPVDTPLKLIGFEPPPAIRGYIKQGQWDAAVGVDGSTTIWAEVDALTRMVVGEPLTAGKEQGPPPIEILSKRDITVDSAQGWKAYPDFSQLRGAA